MPAKRTVQVLSSKGDSHYPVTLEDGKATSCTCMGYTNRQGRGPEEGQGVRPGAQATALLYLLRLDLRRWRHARWTEAYNAYRVAAHRAVPYERR